MNQPHISPTTAMRHIILDTETTGLSAKHGHRIIEIACLELVNNRPTGRSFHTYIDPERPCDPDATRVHGLTDSFLLGKPTFADKVDDILNFVAGATLVIHNAPFDLAFLNAELQRLQRPALHHTVTQVIDTLIMARQAFPGKRHSLDALCERFDIDRSGRQLHGALLDAQLLAKVYQRLRTQHIERTLEAKLSAPSAPNPLNDHTLWLNHLTTCLPEDARVEVTIVQHFSANGTKPSPTHCSFQVRMLDIHSNSMSQRSCQLKFVDQFDGDAA
jgi:DNA polymerase III epsilon subunit